MTSEHSNFQQLSISKKIHGQNRLLLNSCELLDSYVRVVLAQRPFDLHMVDQPLREIRDSCFEWKNNLNPTLAHARDELDQFLERFDALYPSLEVLTNKLNQKDNREDLISNLQNLKSEAESKQSSWLILFESLQSFQANIKVKDENLNQAITSINIVSIEDKEEIDYLHAHNQSLREQIHGGIAIDAGLVAMLIIGSIIFILGGLIDLDTNGMGKKFILFGATIITIGSLEILLGGISHKRTIDRHSRNLENIVAYNPHESALQRISDQVTNLVYVSKDVADTLKNINESWEILYNEIIAAVEKINNIEH
ncbi:HBL/NHE enterotoxin family protein [Candidatus Nitrosacidococcus sp. I8]|uniref:HBL/NHE enterotoxin family protein n=1 Tax=Candidatus Nitrosacidococcus sp. I8 TaxID=2942908 RepID=UPI0022278BFC|nr:HBL/NHE enterotoxin family protein [Candidatus Nitrosacidococcus sp. I8]CAH9017792.1 hypothetical protein NURINAE_00556 [Candidatus Nitrosacidococcus sp. I8]